MTEMTEIDRLISAIAALTQIACYGDHAGNLLLERKGSYNAFDEPNSVRIARETLSEINDRAPRRGNTHRK